MNKPFIIFLIIILVIIAVPFGATAVNGVAINGIANFQLNIIDPPFSATTILASSGGQVTNLDVQSNYIDITLDNLSTITFNTTAPGRYLKITPASGPNFTATPACITATITLTGIGATTIVRLEVTSTAPVCPGGAGGGHTPVFPTNYSVTINNNSAQTSTVAVTLNLSAPNAVQVIVSNDPNFYNANWQSFTDPTTMNWSLEPGDGTKTVYVIYKSSDGNVSPVLSDSIELQTGVIVPPVPPVVPPVPPVPTPTSFSTGNYSANEALNISITISIDKGLTALPAPAILPCSAEVLIKLADDHNPLTQADSSVYYCGVDGRRYVFPNPSTYFSWYQSFSGIQIISAQAMAAIPLGSANVTVRPGSRLVKFLTNPKVYAVAPGGTLRWVVDETTAVALYGSDWNKWVIDISDAFYTNYHIADNITLDLITLGSSLPSASLLVISPTTPAPTQCHSPITFTQDLIMGSSGPQVLALQNLLKCLGYLPADIVANAYLGQATHDAVVKFQQANNLLAEGRVGPQTRALLNKLNFKITI